MEKRKSLSFVLLLSAAILIAAAGIAVDLVTLQASNARLLDAHRLHLEDLAKSVDQNTDNIFQQMRGQTSYSIRYYPDDLGSSPIGMEPLVSDVIVLEGDTVAEYIFGKVCGLRMLENAQGDDIRLGVDEKGNGYLVFLVEGEDGRTYGSLLDLETFYQHIVVSAVIYHYWVVLYDQSANLMLQNDEEQPAFLLFEREQVDERNDGYSILQRRELAGSFGTDLYSFVNRDTGQTVSCQMSVVTTADNLNGSFAIGVAADTMHVTQAMQNTVVNLLLGALLIVCSITLLLFSMMNHRRKANTIQEKLDLTQQLLEKQKELARNQRLESLGVMTSSIAHEFNNLLTPITGYSLMCMEKLPEDSEELYDNLLAIYQAADKARITVQRISALTKKNSSSACSPVNPDEIVGRTLELSYPSKPKNVEILTSLTCDQVLIQANETQVLQVLLNLLLNAFQALEEVGGTVSLGTALEGESVVFTVADNGPGIPAEILERIFEPFFTTKETGKGSGLGLAIVQQVAENHNGSITVQSQPGSGTVFRLRLPICQNGAIPNLNDN